MYGGPGGSPPWRVQGGALVGCGAKPHEKKCVLSVFYKIRLTRFLHKLAGMGLAG